MGDDWLIHLVEDLKIIFEKVIFEADTVLTLENK